MSFLSTLFDFIFPITSTSRFGSEEEVLESGMGNAEIMAINPATGMPMVGGVEGIDAMGNMWGQCDSLGGGVIFSSIDCTSGLFESDLMFDAGSIFD